jgi:hypothetical protein
MGEGGENSTYLENSKSYCELCIVLEGLLFVFVTLYGSQFYVTGDFLSLRFEESFL